MPCDSTEQKQKQARHVQSHHVNHPSRPNSIAQMAVAVTGAVLLPRIIRKHPLSISRLFLVVFFNYRLNRRQKKDKMKKKEGESGKTSRNSMPKRGAFAAKTYILPIRLSRKQNYYHKRLMEFFNEC